MTLKLQHIFLFLILLWNPGFSQQITEIKSIKQNTRDYSEFGPSYFENGIVYCTNAKQKIIESKQSTDNKSFYNFQFFSASNNSVKKEAFPLDTLLNSTFNDGPLATNNNILVFAKNYEKKNIGKKKAKVGLYFCYKKDNTWSTPIGFEYNTDSVNFGHPSINEAGDLIYFSSDKNGGFGGFDLYKSQFLNGKWTEPENLGAIINSSADELFPFIHSSGRLYFSTNKNDSAKKFDIYYSNYVDQQWSIPYRLNEPINSAFNDFSYICDNTTENGYFASDRNGSDDIFQFYSTLPSFEVCDTMIERNYCYHFEEAKTVNLDTIPGIYVWVFSDNTRIKSEQADHCFPGPGLYNVVLNMIDTVTNEVDQTIASYDILVEDPIEPYIICPEKANVNTVVEFDGTQTNLPDKKLEQFVWTFSDNKAFIGQKISRSFDKPGIYRVNLGVTFDKDEKGNVQKKCVFKEIVIE